MMKIALLIAAVATLISSPSKSAEFSKQESPANLTVQISTRSPRGEIFSGTGILIGTDDRRQFLITVAHLIQNTVPTEIVISMKDGLSKKLNISCTVDQKLDFSVCEIPKVYHIESMGWGFWLTPKVAQRGDKLFFVGRDGGWYEPTVPAVINSVTNDGFLIDNIDIREGSSGAPLYNGEGVYGLISKKVSSSSAFAVSIKEVMKVLEIHGAKLNPASRQILTYDEATQHGNKFVAQKMKEQQGTGDEKSEDYKVEPGEVRYVGPIVASVLSENTTDVLQIWESSGFGGGNHYEYYLSLFSQNSWKSGILDPMSTLQIGTDLLGQPDQDISKMTVLSDGQPERFLIKIPSCRKENLDAHNECSAKVDIYYTYCPNNSQDYRLIELGQNEEDANNYSSFQRNLGVNLNGFGGDYELDSLNRDWIQAGIKPKTNFHMFEILSITDKELSKKYGLSVGDFVVSTQGRPAENLYKLSCALANIPRSEEEGRTVHVWQSRSQTLATLKVELRE